MVEHPPLDEHEAGAAVADLNAPALVALGIIVTAQVEHEGSGVVVQVLFAIPRSVLNAFPVDFLLRAVPDHEREPDYPRPQRAGPCLSRE